MLQEKILLLGALSAPLLLNNPEYQSTKIIVKPLCAYKIALLIPFVLCPVVPEPTV